jgi:mono/diheme cytochrome c family protein
VAAKRINLANIQKDNSNHKMKLIAYSSLLLCAVFTSAGETNQVLLARGKYLVEAAGACADCHTARDWKGTPDRAHWLQGAKLDFKPARFIPAWSENAPAIAGLPGFATDELALKYFETAINAAGNQSSPPMPRYQFNHEDALAIVGYLRSLPPPKK